ncbi:MAG: hypothetical protein ACR2OZ_16360 [Verrucomicrobiales bacterium]
MMTRRSLSTTAIGTFLAGDPQSGLAQAFGGKRPAWFPRRYVKSLDDSFFDDEPPLLAATIGLILLAFSG